jgi:hypothetical protein
MTGDEPDSQQLAQQAALNASPDELKKVIDFSHEVFTTAENHDLSNDQLMASLMAVITMLVKETGNTDQQKEVCTQLVIGLWTTIGLEGPPSLDFLLSSSEQVH